ncbi:DUF1203 domain-containing protein [Terricaulis sp.]|uniref:DUF1203 domain-containing protein n=1 Tax=Terricaulis sp. TaxID=2768686 RepID=UPI003782EDE1
MTFRITGLDPAPFRQLHALSDAALAARNVRRVRVEEKPGAPCRISLADAEIGEHVLLLNHEHLPAETPYRQQGPIFVRETDHRFDARDAMPPALAIRLLSLRGFDDEAMMIEADVVEGADAPALIERFFENTSVAYIHAHYARRGCFAALIER